MDDKEFYKKLKRIFKDLDVLVRQQGSDMYGLAAVHKQQLYLIKEMQTEIKKRTNG